MWEALQLETGIHSGRWICVGAAPKMDPPLLMKRSGWDVPNHLSTVGIPCGAERDVAFLLASRGQHGTVCVNRWIREGMHAGTEEQLWWNLLLQSCGDKYAHLAMIPTRLADDLASLCVD